MSIDKTQLDHLRKNLNFLCVVSMSGVTAFIDYT